MYMSHRYRQIFNLNPPLEIVRQPYQDKEQEKLRNRFPLSELLHQSPKTYEVSADCFHHIIQHYFYMYKLKKTVKEYTRLTFVKIKQGIRFTCEGTITSINASRDWYYPSCTTCSLKAEYNDGVFECKVHGPLEYPSYR